MHTSRPARKNPTARARRRGRTHEQWPPEILEIMEESLDREIRRWAKHLLFMDGDAGVVRYLTDEEVESMVAASRAKTVGAHKKRAKRKRARQ